MTSTEIAAGPRRHPLLGNLIEYRRDPLDFVTQCARRYGDFVPLRLGPYNAVLLNDPAGIEQVLVETNTNYGRHLLARLSGSLMGKGLFTSEGELWRRERKLIAPAFHRSAVNAMGDVMAATASDVADTWIDGAEIEAMGEMARITVQNVSKALFHADVANDAPDVAAALGVVFDTFQQRLESLYPLPDWIPTPSNRRYQWACKTLDATIYRIIEERRRLADKPDDLLSMLMAVQEANADAMPDRLLRDEVMALFIGGHEPVAGGLSFLWYLLDRNPGARARLHEELDRELGGRRPTVADLGRLPYTAMVVKEALRLYPPAWGFDRKVTRDCEIGGRPVKKGTLILIMQWALHRDPRWFNRPEEFLPERWADESTSNLPKYAYLPFGGGPRFCIGNMFASMEMQLVLATVAGRFTLEMVPGATVTPQPSITLRPRNGIAMRVRRRATGGTGSGPLLSGSKNDLVRDVGL